MTRLHAQPYDISAHGFFFESVDEYNDNIKTLKNNLGFPVEEFEIQFIDGENIDSFLFHALKIHQGNFGRFLEVAENWSYEDKVKVSILTNEAGYSFDISKDDPDDFSVDLYEVDRMVDLAAQFVEEGLYGEIPKSLENYIDLDAIARDLSFDYGECTIDGKNYIYRTE